MQHTIQIGFDTNGNPVPIDGEGEHSEIDCVVHHEDEIRWKSDLGEVRVEFQGATPFAAGNKIGDVTFRAIAADAGTFLYKCTVTTQDGKKHGWPDNPNGGGTVEVGSGSRT